MAKNDAGSAERDGHEAEEKRELRQTILTIDPSRSPTREKRRCRVPTDARNKREDKRSEPMDAVVDLLTQELRTHERVCQLEDIHTNQRQLECPEVCKERDEQLPGRQESVHFSRGGRSEV